jgi:hypothetical protein
MNILMNLLAILHQLCNLAKESPSRYHWRVVDDIIDKAADSDRNRSDSQEQVSTYESLEKANALYPDLKTSLKTEMSYMLYQGETGNVPIFIVGFGFDRIEYKPQKMNFFSGLGYAIYVAAFDLDSESDDAVLNQREFLPRTMNEQCYTSTKKKSIAMLMQGE